MALTIVSSNRVETLQARLAQQLIAAPLEDPFASEVIVVPTFAMARWLNLRFAQQQGIAANIHYPQAAEWIWQVAGTILGDLPPRDPCSSDSLLWQIFDRLPDLTETPPFAVLNRYLADDRSGIKRWQLSQRVADSFDRFQSYRPQLIRDWSNGNEDHWQAHLWRDITARPDTPHRVDSMARLAAELANNPAAQSLPHRVSLFALSSLAPLYLEILPALAQSIEICLYLHSPTDQYWADLENEKRRSRRRLTQPENADLFETGDELLASWGRQGQLFQDLLLSQDHVEAIDIDLFSAPTDKSLLNDIQRAIYTLQPASSALRADDSISVHVCHSPMRECQVLLDQILGMLEQDPELESEDFLVMIPDIGSYAPYIEAVFRGHKIAFNISDITLADEHPLVMTFLQLLNLPHCRFTFSDILALLDSEALCRRFEFDNHALGVIRHLGEEAHTRWGIDARHKAAFDLPATDGNTWQQTRARFFAGYALATDELWQGLAPLPARDDGDNEIVGRFWHFIECLCRWRERLAKTRAAGEWQTLLMHMVDEFFLEADPRESRLQQIRDAISQLRAPPNCEISPELAHYLMQRQLSSNEHSGQLYSGGVTFCGMRPMRSIPFKVICVLGMNRQDFPRRDPIDDFEIPAAIGDPSKRIEDRYLMLETLLCARQKLYFSYTGRHLKDNSPLQPSVLLQELLDYIDARFDRDNNGAGLSQQLIREHPMQAFGSKRFAPPTDSYDDYWCDVARQMAVERSPAARDWQHPISQSTLAVDGIELDHLRRFVNHPIQYFFRQRLGIYLEDDDLPADDEPFDLNPLEQWQLKHRLATDSLSGNRDGVQRLFAEGLLAHGPAAAAQVQRIQQEQAEWVEQLQVYRDRPPRPLQVEVDVGQPLVGTVDIYYPGLGLMKFHAGKFKGRHLLLLWIDHLAYCAAGAWHKGDTSLLLTRDESWRLPPVAPESAIGQLEEYCRLYRQGLDYPLAVLPDCSYAWASEPDRDKALAKAMRIWHNQWGGNAGGDNSNPYVRLALRGYNEPPIGSELFEQNAQRLYQQLLTQAQKI